MPNTYPPTRTPGSGAAFLRALRLRCPRCGEGRLFSGYLKQFDRCATCNEDFTEVRADDATSWLTILIVGILLGPVVGLVETHTSWPVGVSIAVWCVAGLALMLAVLPRAKAFLITAIWLTRRTPSKD